MREIPFTDVFAASQGGIGAEAVAVQGAVAPHTHAFLEIAFAVAGRARYETATVSRTIGRGDVTVVRPGTWHAYSQCDEFQVINLYVDSTLFFGELRELTLQPVLVDLLLSRSEAMVQLDESRLAPATMWLDALSQIASTGRRLTQLGLTLCVLGELAIADFGMALSHPTERLNDDLLNVIRAVLAEPAHEWTVAEMAAVGHRSISAFHRAFAAQLGSGPKSWLEQVRAEHAATLLARTAMPVAQVARDSGWSDPNYFSRRFRARYGTQPSQYRRAFSAIQGDRHGGSRSAS